MIKAAVQHRDRFIRSGLVHVLGREPDIEVVGQVSGASELVVLCADTRPEAVLLEADATLWDAPRLVAVLRKRQRLLRVIGMHDGLTADAGRRIYQAGVRHTVSYEMGADSLIAALRGRQLAPLVVSLPTAAPLPRNVLTVRECDVLRLVAQGLRTREIAADLDISLKTVENHKQRLFRKLDVQNQAHAVAVAMRQGLLSTSAGPTFRPAA